MLLKLFNCVCLDIFENRGENACEKTSLGQRNIFENSNCGNKKLPRELLDIKEKFRSFKVIKAKKC